MGGAEEGRRREEATWLREATAGVEQLSLFSGQIRVESDPVMAANWLKQRRIGPRNISVRLLSSYRLVSRLQLGPLRQLLMRKKFVNFGLFQTSFDAVSSLSAHML